MSSEFERFNDVFFGETASEQDIEVLEKIATDLLEGIPHESVQTVHYVADNTDAHMCLETIQFDDTETAPPSASIQFSRLFADATFKITFNHLNKLTYLGYPTEDELSETKKMIHELQSTAELSPYAQAILKHINQLLNTIHEDTTSEAFTMVRTITDQSTMHVADAIRKDIKNVLGDTSLLYTSYQYGWIHTEEATNAGIAFHNSPSLYEKTIVVTRAQVSGHLPDDELEESADKLVISLHDEKTDLTLCYRRSQTDKVSCKYETSDNDPGKEYANDADESEYSLSLLGDDFLDDLYNDKPTKTSIETLTQALIDASIKDVLDFPTHAHEIPSLYPTLEFWFNTQLFFKNGEIDSTSVTQEALRTLRETCTEELPIYSPGSSSELPDYTMNPNRHIRTQKFLKQSVTGFRGEKMRREAIIDIHDACEIILENLYQENHPISQLLNTLGCDFGELLDHGVLEEVTKQVIIQTQEKQLRHLYNQRIAAWRIGKHTCHDVFSVEA